ncbi:MAG TPA: amidohydrolase family protein [Spongiibacteraceae bacterium]|jgi:predicted TIM-barrel fold metal-dependent hydrolase
MTAATAINANEKIVSVDSHVFFTDEWITARLPQNLRQKYIDGNKLFQQQEVEKRGGWNPDIVDMFDPYAWEDPGHYEPHAKLKSMDRDGVYAEVIFPEVGAAKVCSPAIMGDDWKTMLSGYNDAIADFASVDRNRLMCAYQLLPFDIDASIKEVHRVAERGGRCVQLPPFPTELGLRDYFDTFYDRLWGAIQEADITILNHLDSNLKQMDHIKRDPTPQKAVALGLPVFQLAETISFWILPGTLERFPKLKVMLVEPGLGWLPYLFDTILDGRIIQGHYKFPNLTMLPSEYFKRQMGATFMYEPVGLKYAYDYFGPDVLFWSTDFPHPATSWPNSRELIEKQFNAAAIPTADRRKILCDNGLRMFAVK